MTDIAGHQVYQSATAGKRDLYKVDLSNLNNGVYFMNIHTSNGSQTMKLTIMK